MEWPTAEIDRTVIPTDAQRASLVALRTPPPRRRICSRPRARPTISLHRQPRLAAVGKRLDTVLQAVKTVSPALTDFYATLSDEQKASSRRSVRSGRANSSRYRLHIQTSAGTAFLVPSKSFGVCCHPFRVFNPLKAGDRGLLGR